jgi:hypothetical protein
MPPTTRPPTHLEAVAATLKKMRREAFELDECCRDAGHEPCPDDGDLYQTFLWHKCRYETLEEVLTSVLRERVPDDME